MAPFNSFEFAIDRDALLIPEEIEESDMTCAWSKLRETVVLMEELSFYSRLMGSSRVTAPTASLRSRPIPQRATLRVDTPSRLMGPSTDSSHQLRVIILSSGGLLV